MRRYLVIYEKGRDGFGAYVPDLPGCTSAGATKKEVEENIVEAITLHLEVMKVSGLEIPEGISESEMLVLSWKMKYKEVVKMIEDDGWVQVRQKGSHRAYKHEKKIGIVTIAYHRLSDELAEL